MDSRKESILRAEELSAYNTDYLKARKQIPKGTDMAVIDRCMTQKEKILEVLGASDDEWDDWKWQFQNRIEDVEMLGSILKLSKRDMADIAKVSKLYRWAITPYYLSLINPKNLKDPIRLMSIPSIQELDPSGYEDPMNERNTNPAGVITRRYPDRLIINVTNSCAMFCRHCQRRRRIGECDRDSNIEKLQQSVEYIAKNKDIRDVLITGGDPLTLKDGFLEALIARIRSVPHVEIIRIGTRTLVTMPQRITDKLVDMLKKYHPIYINTQFNHPQELTLEAIQACEKLVNAGIPLGNQMVLLEGVNNDKYVVRSLNQGLLRARVRPYYIFHAKQVVGTEHFLTSIDDGLEIMDHLRGFTSGMAIPTYIVNAPGGLGKIPLLPNYILEQQKDYVKLRTWEGREVTYPNHTK